MFENLKPYHIVLASQSPRRREIFRNLGLDFEVRVLPDVEENYPQGLTGEEIARYIAAGKAQRYIATMKENELLITADTIVCVDDTILGKPKDEREAKTMLRMLSGRSHEVITAFTVNTTQRSECVSVVTKVKFSVLTDEIIDYYVSNCRPYDKAGAYGIQEWIGYVGVEGIEGSFFNVVGLPIQRLVKVLMTF